MLDFTSHIEYSFKTTRIIDDTLLATTYKLKTELWADEDAPKALVHTIMENIHIWFEFILPHCIIYSEDDTKATNILFNDQGECRFGNYPMVLPYEPGDDILLLVLIMKMNALGQDVVFFGKSELVAYHRNKSTCVFDGEPIDYLELTEDCSNWWERGDFSVNETDDFGDFKPLAVPGEKRPTIKDFKPTLILGGKKDDPKS